MAVPEPRIRQLNANEVDPTGDYILYWMTAARRLQWNFSLQRAVELANQAGKPLLILEALRVGYPAASDRLHAFVIDGMAVNRRLAAKSRATYYPYVEPTPDAGKGLLQALATPAAAVVTDWYPAFFLPRMLAAAIAQVPVRFEAVDTNGLIPLSSHDRTFTVVRSYRAFVQRSLPDHLRAFPDDAPLHLLARSTAARVPAAVGKRWPAASAALLKRSPRALARLPIDHTVPVAPIAGGSDEARRALKRFTTGHLAHYHDRRNSPDDDGTSRLSPFLHFGHISVHEIFSEVMTHERWTTRRLAKAKGGKRDGWWGVAPGADAFLDQLVVWRELSFNGCERIPDYASYRSLPAWSRKTLTRHQRDRRPHLYSIAELDRAGTHDEIWNAAQRQLVAEGWFSGYLRMLWAKKILEWSPRPTEALARMRTLMDRYSLDGRDPNSYSGYAWTLGRYDRPWPERPIFGTIRYMSSASTRRKLKLTRFLARYTHGVTAPARRSS